jgi:hypothetical protein
MQVLRGNELMVGKVDRKINECIQDFSKEMSLLQTPMWALRRRRGVTPRRNYKEKKK